MKNETSNIETTTLGRPVNPNSARQQRLAELEAKRNNGELKRGRPVNGTSARQARLAELAAKAEMNGGSIKRGRPSNGESERQKRLAERAAKAASGIEIKRGRPAMVKAKHMKLKQVLLNMLAIIMAFEFIGISILCIKYPNWGGLVVITVSAIAFVIAFNKAFFYKYEH